MLIESTRNETVKRARALASSKGRREQGLHLIEGETLAREAVASGVRLREAFVEQGREDMVPLLEGAGARVYIVTRPVLESVCTTETPQGVCATAVTPETAPPAAYPEGLVVALDRLSDPGNLGTILRTADAMGAAGLLLGEGSADPFAPKPVRASMGSVYHLPLWQGPLMQELPRLKEQGFLLLCGHLAGDERWPEVGSRCALVIGNESRGVSDEVSELCHKVRLPMRGRAESLNAAVAAGIFLYELAGRMPGHALDPTAPARNLL